MTRPISASFIGLTFLALQPRTALGQAQSLEAGYRASMAENRTVSGSIAGGPFLGFRLAPSRLPFLGFEAFWVPSATAARLGSTHRERSFQAGLSFRFSPPQRLLFFEIALGRSWVTYWDSFTGFESGRRRMGLTYVRLGTGVRTRVGSRGPMVLAGLRHQWASQDFLEGDYGLRKGLELLVGVGTR